MKRICILLALALVLAGVPAFAAEGDAILGLSAENTLSFNYCFAQGDTLYLVSYGSLFAYRPGDADLREYTIEIPESNLTAGGSFEYSTLPFCSDGKLYSLNLITEYGEDVEFKGATVTELTLREDGTVSSDVVCDVDWSEMVDFYDNSSYPIQPDIILGMSGQAFARYNDDQGDYRTVAVDLATGETRQIEDLTGAFTIAPYKDETLLAEMYVPEIDSNAKLFNYDPADGSLRQLCEIPVEDYSPLAGLAYDSAADTVYCIKAGEICPVDMQAATVGEGVADMPLDAYNAAPGCILEGGYFAYCGDGAAIRNLDPAQKAQTKLKISDSFWTDSVNSAYYRFVNAHGDVSVVLSREYSEVENLIENMMNRDDRIDVYVLPTSSSMYEALYNRGYLMELDGDEKIKAFADSMYPSLREQFSTNGRLVALPISTYGWSVGLNEMVLEKLGMKLEDVPTSWSEFLDFLGGLQDKVNKDTEIHLVNNGYSESDVRYEMLNTILMDYQYYVNATNPDMGYDSPLLHELLDKLEKIDFVALGCRSDDEEGEIELDGFDEETVLLQISTGCSIGNFYGEFTPVLMQISSDVPPHLVLDCSVLVVNPFSKNAEAALAFASEVVDNISTQTRYCLLPDLNEPIRGQQNQATLDELKEDLDALIKDYEEAPAEEKQSLEMDVRDEQSNYDYAEKYNWDVSPRELEWYRSHDDNIIISIYNWLYPDTTSEEDDGSIGQTAEAEALMDQYLMGQISLNDMLTGIDRKVQMRRLEGN